VEPIEKVRVLVRTEGGESEREDALAVEEPLEIRLRPEGAAKATNFVTTMRTPGHDEELAAGLLFAEGVLAAPSDLVAMERPSDPRIDPALRDNVLVGTVTPAAFARSEKLRRGTVMGSACGVCGKTSIEAVIPADRPPLLSSMRLGPGVLLSLPGGLRPHQSVFSQTGGLHAAALFGDAGEVRRVREDIGRHNAVDKLVGAGLRNGELPFSDAVLMVSGRAGFEIVQKAYAAGIPIVASVSAPSSLAVELADAGGLTLIGFLRERRYNVYTHSYRILPA
jgi:FdhD protein